MKVGGKGGGNTITGLKFETKVDLKTLLENIPGYEVKKLKEKLEILFITKVKWWHALLRNMNFIVS